MLLCFPVLNDAVIVQLFFCQAELVVYISYVYY